MESLTSPAADVVKSLDPDTSPADLMSVLDSAFGTVQDGEELFAQFLNTLQNPGERPSAYLQRLQHTICSVVKQGGVPATEVDKHLLKQFCRGCWDNALITKLQLEQRRSNPPPFPDLLFQLRTEEDRQTAKESLMKQHMSTSKQRVNIQSQSACACGQSPHDNDELKDMKQQLKRLQQQMSQLLSRKPATESQPTARQHKTSHPSPKSPGRPKPWYCFNCGEDGHISSACVNKANPVVVQQKRKILQQKREAWDVKNKQTLN
ncbi:paraneoplastic antigen Ma1 homolog [Oryzias melastigma]|uniref:paraneoplastic antigen Ma1 homolog n=1 Tax=Oryzias melastigma TaxID=30732 RepID=UPI000CF81CA6|nr:paraneoplastic antigen Ma1 homolog [Oryzias melastigma]